MITVEFKYNINDKVKIITNGIVGRVIGLYFTEDEVKEECVEYTDGNGLIITRWVREARLELEE